MAATSEEPIPRRAARLLVVDDAERLLLFRGGDPGRPDAGSWWFTVGGGVDSDEDLRGAAVCELGEETGLVLEPAQLGPMVAEREVVFEFMGAHYCSRESFFFLRVLAFHPNRAGWSVLERQQDFQHRWWACRSWQRRRKWFARSGWPH